MCQSMGVLLAWLLNHSILFYLLYKTSLEVTIHLRVIYYPPPLSAPGYMKHRPCLPHLFQSRIWSTVKTQ